MGEIAMESMEIFTLLLPLALTLSALDPVGA